MHPDTAFALGCWSFLVACVVGWTLVCIFGGR
jgi:hypothetical protein